MLTFKNRVALEACPAKTAESVSYGVAFSVLGFLLVSNYWLIEPGEARAGQVVSASSTSTAPIALDVPAPIVLDLNPGGSLAFSEMQGENASATNLQNLAVPDTGIRDLLVAAPLPQLDPPSSEALLDNTHKRSFASADWKHLTEEPELQTESLVAPSSEFLVQTFLDFDSFLVEARDIAPNRVAESSGALLSGTEPADQSLVINGTKEESQATSRVQIPRPQLPRSYRAQDIQRSLVLPPRIQALKP